MLASSRSLREFPNRSSTYSQNRCHPFHPLRSISVQRLVQKTLFLAPIQLPSPPSILSRRELDSAELIVLGCEVVGQVGEKVEVGRAVAVVGRGGGRVCHGRRLLRVKVAVRVVVVVIVSRVVVVVGGRVGVGWLGYHGCCGGSDGRGGGGHPRRGGRERVGRGHVAVGDVGRLAALVHVLLLQLACLLVIVGRVTLAWSRVLRAWISLCVGGTRSRTVMMMMMVMEHVVVVVLVMVDVGGGISRIGMMVAVAMCHVSLVRMIGIRLATRGITLAALHASVVGGGVVGGRLVVAAVVLPVITPPCRILLLLLLLMMVLLLVELVGRAWVLVHGGGACSRGIGRADVVGEPGRLLMVALSRVQGLVVNFVGLIRGGGGGGGGRWKPGLLIQSFSTIVGLLRGQLSVVGSQQRAVPVVDGLRGRRLIDVVLMMLLLLLLKVAHVVPC